MRIVSEAFTFMTTVIVGIGGLFLLFMCADWWRAGQYFQALLVPAMVIGCAAYGERRTRPKRHCFPSPWTGIDGHTLDEHSIKELIERAELENSEMDWNWAQEKQRQGYSNGLIWVDRIVVVRCLMRVLEAQEQNRKTSSSK